MAKSERGKSAARKPLSDISNGGKPSRCIKTKVDAGGGGALDGLLLVRSDLAALISQVDELVAHAVEHRIVSEKGTQLIQSFSNVLADMHSSLKPWIPRFQHAFGSPTTVSEAQAGEPKDTDFISGANGQADVAPIEKSEPDLDLIVSPSPLVSWRAGTCKVESGRQLFLLTPLPKSKILATGKLGSFRKTAKIFAERDLPHDTLPSLPAVPRNACDDLLERREVKPASSNVPKPCTVPAKDKPESWIYMNFTVQSRKEKSVYLLTPISKTSLPKNHAFLDQPTSCFEQEIGSFSQATQIQNDFNESFSQATQNDFKESFSQATLTQNDFKTSDDDDAIEGVSQSLASRYQELFSLQPTNKFTSQRREVDGTLDWFLSPPKTCILMEPSNEKALPTPHLLPTPGEGALFSTPMWKDFESTVRKGKQPGENTLKKELWTKFEAASINGLQFDASVFQNTTRKGFLDMLEEASFESTAPDSGIGR